MNAKNQSFSGKENRGRGLARKVGAALLAVLSGVANGLFGGGGGMLVVPALGKCLKLEEKKAHATAIAVMMPLSLVSGIVYTLRGIYDLSLALSVGAGAAVGGAIGALMLKNVPKGVLSFLFNGIMIYAGIRFLI